MKPEQRWTTQDLDNEIVVDAIWASWTKLFNTVEVLFNEGQMTEQTYSQMFQCLLDLKPVLCKYLEEKK